MRILVLEEAGLQVPSHILIVKVMTVYPNLTQFWPYKLIN